MAFALDIVQRTPMAGRASSVLSRFALESRTVCRISEAAAVAVAAAVAAVAAVAVGIAVGALALARIERRVCSSAGILSALALTQIRRRA